MLALRAALLLWFQRCASAPHCVECVPKNPPAYPPFFPVFSLPGTHQPEAAILSMPLFLNAAACPKTRDFPPYSHLASTANTVWTLREPRSHSALALHPPSFCDSQQLPPSTFASNLRNR